MRAELARVTAEVVVVGVPGDLLFPYALQHELYRELQAAGAIGSLWKLDSEFGHDAFLADQDRLAVLLRASGVLGAAASRARRSSGVGDPAAAGDPDRHDRLRRGRRRRARAARAPGGALAERYGVRFRVTRLAVRDAGKVRGGLAAGIPITTRAEELVADPEVDVIVEVAGGEAVEAALTAALAAGKPVVTANKALLAKRLRGWACSRSAPRRRSCARPRPPPRCRSSATSRTAPTRSKRCRRSSTAPATSSSRASSRTSSPLDRAIAEAQRLGFAEADPSADLDGHDAAAKLSILAYRAFGAWIPPDQLAVRGIRELRAGRLRSGRGRWASGSG